ncbi:hypothetical protein ACOMHN_055892 [Nucella lapillus]
MLYIIGTGWLDGLSPSTLRRDFPVAVITSKEHPKGSGETAPFHMKGRGKVERENLHLVIDEKQQVVVKAHQQEGGRGVDMHFPHIPQ